MIPYMVSGNVDMILYNPVVRKMWKQHELWDGTYNLSDLLDINEAIIMQEGNKSLYLEHEFSKIKTETNMNGFNIPKMPNARR